jgi:hypothetical protein
VLTTTNGSPGGRGARTKGAARGMTYDGINFEIRAGLGRNEWTRNRPFP